MYHTTHTWKHMTQAKKRHVWKELGKFQNGLCVYCESKAVKGKNLGHIEHFYDKSTHANLTFDWNNLFGCCDSKFHCGHYKDQTLPGGIRRKYNVNLLIKPDVEDPENYFQFFPSGKIEKKHGLSTLDEQKAIETIKALKLDDSSLERSREQQITHFQSRVSAALSIIDNEDDEETIVLAISEYTEIEQEAKTALHRTAIKQAVIWMTN
ncbi:retron Ec78 anti-phage system effector HNH endonuclease PtuB [Aliivibrio fischeri]|uniref:retron Ec78 anti-phage system effector HNH endonuclease PtuB n=1 Tax=Aliivibrio fischeri TaxID=668 RepID=UPI00235048CA|nr:retron Ec78 anti-phage system effector HNH endonuclease PtuB [Aliivibrio fischeri]